MSSEQSDRPRSRSEPLLEVEDLRGRVRDRGRRRPGRRRRAASTSTPGEVLAIVGESGSGKSVTAHDADGAHALAERAASTARRTTRARSSSAASDDELRKVRGAEIAMIFQDPMTSLNPVHQDRRPDRRADPGARGRSDGEARERAVELLERVGIPRAARARSTATRTSSRAACASA